MSIRRRWMSGESSTISTLSMCGLRGRHHDTRGSDAH
jgi:hypothetical protein